MLRLDTCHHVLRHEEVQDMSTRDTPVGTPFLSGQHAAVVTMRVLSDTTQYDTRVTH